MYLYVTTSDRRYVKSLADILGNKNYIHLYCYTDPIKNVVPHLSKTSHLNLWTTCLSYGVQCLCVTCREANVNTGATCLQ